MLGAAFGDYPRVIAAPLDIGDCFKIIPEIFNIADRFQCPGLVLCDLLLSEGRLSVDPKDLDFNPAIDRGELITTATAASGTDGNGGYKRYKITESGISPRAIPGVPGHTHTAATDEHEEDGVLISDEFTNPTKRRAMMEKRMRKVGGIEAAVPPPDAGGPARCRVTLIGWGSTKGVIEEACETPQRAGHLGQPASDPLARASAWRGDSRDSERLAAHHSSWRTTTAASSRATCAAKPASCRTATSANTTESRSCRTTLWKR